MSGEQDANYLEVSTTNMISIYEEQLMKLTREIVMVKAALLQVQEELSVYKLAEEYRNKAIEKKDKEQAELAD